MIFFCMSRRTPRTTRTDTHVTYTAPFRASNGYHCIAHDRRGHGRSGQRWKGNDMDTYADDLAALVETLDLKNAIHVGHSTGGGEVARYIGQIGRAHV